MPTMSGNINTGALRTQYIEQCLGGMGGRRLPSPTYFTQCTCRLVISVTLMQLSRNLAEKHNKQPPPPFQEVVITYFPIKDRSGVFSRMVTRHPPFADYSGSRS